MRTTAAVVGMFGGFVGVYVSLAVVVGTALFGAVASAFGSRAAGSPVVFGLVALAFFTLGVIGGVLVLQRPTLGGVVMLIAGVGGLVATILVFPAVTTVLAGAAGSRPIPSPINIFAPRPAFTPTRAPAPHTPAPQL